MILLVFNQICMTSLTFSYPMKLRVVYACCSSVSEARFSESTCVVMECYEDPCFLTVIIFSMNEIVPVSVYFFLL